MYVVKVVLVCVYVFAMHMVEVIRICSCTRVGVCEVGINGCICALLYIICSFKCLFECES